MQRHEVKRRAAGFVFDESAIRRFRDREVPAEGSKHMKATL
jgi:hypothetical protein